METPMAAGMKPFYAKAALQHFVSASDTRRMPAAKLLSEAIGEVKALAKEQAGMPGNSRLKFVLDPSGEVPANQWKMWFVARLLEHLGIEASESEVRKAVRAARDEVALKLKAGRLKPRLILISDHTAK